MPHTLDSGILVDCTGALDTDATDDLLKVVVTALDTCAYPTNIILDWRGCRGNSTQHHRCTEQVASLMHPRLGMVAAVASATGRFQVKRMCEVQDYSYLACTSLQEAELLLKRWITQARQPDEPFREYP